MILCADRQALVRRIQAWTLSDSPAQQNAVKFEPQIVMQPRRVVFLNEIRKASPRILVRRRRLGRFAEITFPSVFFEYHGEVHSRLGAIAAPKFSALPPARS